MKSRGFSLIELIIVITLTGILGAALMIALPSKNLFQTNSFADTLIQNLNLVKTLSISKNQRYRMIIGKTSLQVQDQHGTNISLPGMGHLALTYPPEVTVTPTMTIIFDAMGKPYDGAGNALTSILTLTVATPDATSQTITISPQTGFIQ